MAATEVQQQPLSPSDETTLDGVLLPHLHMESQDSMQDNEDTQTLNASGNLNRLIFKRTDSSSLSKSQPSPNRKSLSQPPMKFSQQVSRPSISQSTIESDNKRRSIISKSNASKYDPPSPEPPDPNSETKSATIHRMHSNLQEWDKKLEEIWEKKTKNDNIHRSVLETRDKDIKDLSEKFSKESKLRAKIEKQRNSLSEKLNVTEDDLEIHRQQLEQVQNELSNYEVAYQQLDEQRLELEQEASVTKTQLDQSENMRRRLNDQVTELQGQLAIEEQRSKFCTII